jgi:hypothetical protein
MSSTPFFISAPRIETAATSFTAERNGLSGSVPLFIANPITGSKLETISVIQSTTASGAPFSAIRCMVWLCDANGSNPNIIRELAITNNNVIPVSGPPANIGDNITFNFINGLYLGTNSSIYVGQFRYTDNRDPLHWVAVGADL